MTSARRTRLDPYDCTWCSQAHLRRRGAVIGLKAGNLIIVIVLIVRVGCPTSHSCRFCKVGQFLQSRDLSRVGTMWGLWLRQAGTLTRMLWCRHVVKKVWGSARAGVWDVQDYKHPASPPSVPSSRPYPCLRPPPYLLPFLDSKIKKETRIRFADFGSRECSRDELKHFWCASMYVWNSPP